MAKSEIFFWLLIAFLAGVAVASFLRLPPSVLAGLFAAGGGLFLFGLLRVRERALVGVIGFCLAAASLGAARLLSYEADLRTRVPPFGEMLTLRGTVDEEPSRTARSQRLVVREEERDGRLLVVTRPYPEYRYGDTLKLIGRVERPASFSDGFDYAAYLATAGIFAAMPFPEIERIGSGGGSPVKRLLFTIKSSFAREIDIHLPEPEAAFMAGLILGERRSIPRELAEQFVTTGTSHIVALSGFNITIVAKALLRALTLFWIPISWAFWAAVAGIVLFTVLVGAQASVVRAAVMGVLVLIAHRSGRIYRMRNALAFAGAVMVFANPLILRLDLAFQLSFLATLGLLYVAPMFDRAYLRVKDRVRLFLRDVALAREERLPGRRTSRPSLFREIAVATLAAQLAVLPLIIYRFGRVSVVSPFANLAILPVIPTTMFFGFITGLAGWAADWLAQAIGWVSWVLLHYELAAVRFFAGLPAAEFGLRIPGVLVVFLYLVLGVWIRKASRVRQQLHPPP